MAPKEWVKLPTAWIDGGGLMRFQWAAVKGADNIAALMTLMALAHHADEASGLVDLTYDRLSVITHLSRAKISGGLKVLEAQKIMTREQSRRSTYALMNYGSAPWGKLPARGLYRNDAVSAFAEFHLRRPVELNALKLYLLFVARRGNDTNLANISYEKITAYSGVARGNLKSAISLLAALGLVHVEHFPSETSDYGISSGYRLAHIDPYAHMGTKGRRLVGEGFFDSASDLRHQAPRA